MPETTAQYATGKRKTAIARVWLSAEGDGTIIVNGKSVDEYFERATARMIVRQSFEALELLEKYSARATVTGGGHSAQAEAMRHGIARALIAEDPARRGVLKKAGFLTRDDRKKERKKYGQPGARKRFQYSKR
ncbi:MAG TPA: 30S ribosomal protein S9 [Polyangiaceae bacterium]|jgi:small subunit ribosomal protein S9|nr:30S ribosomal protein S9 [Polyangiaceae bacterium]